MNRRKEFTRNIVLLSVLSYLFLHISGLYLNPISAYEQAERSGHYGPSEMKHIEDYVSGKLILGTYDRWVSYTTIHRTGFFFWRPRGVNAFEYDRSKPLDYSRGIENQFYRLYGIVNDASIDQVEITLGDGTVLSQTDLYEDLFLFTWEEGGYPKSIRGYDAEGNLVYQEATGY